MKLSVAIQAHPRRREEAEALQVQLNQQALGCGVQVPAGGIDIAYDHDSKGAWASAKRAWALGIGKAEHHLVVQDDIVPCADFIRTAAYLAQVVGDPISYFCVRNCIEEALASGRHWVAVKHWLWAQALSMPSYMIAPMLEWVTAHESDRPDWLKSSDARMSSFFLFIEKRVMTTAPSLVEHPTETEGSAAQQSVCGHGAKAFGRTRTAKRFIGVEGRGMAIDWGAGLDNPLKV